MPLPVPFKMVMPVVYTIYFTWNYLQQTGTKIIDDIEAFDRVVYLGINLLNL